MENQLYAHKCSQVVFVFGCAGSPLPRGSFSLAVASPCRDLSLAKRGLWGMQASAAVARGLGTFSSLSLGPGSVIVAQTQLLWSVWDLPGPAMELVFPA